MIVVGRIMGVFLTFYSCRLCFKSRTIKINELLFITWGGMIRGAIAFALVLKIEKCTNVEETEPAGCYSEKNYSLAVSTTLLMVYLTTLCFGTFMAWF